LTNSCQVSVHLRGPLNLKQFAVYVPPKDLSNRGAAVSTSTIYSTTFVCPTTSITIYTCPATPWQFTSALANEKTTSTAVFNSASSVPPVNSAYEDWTRISAYDADQKPSSNVVFLNHKGGQGSGIFDFTFGNSLSYASADAKAGSAWSVLFGGTLKDCSNELVIMTDVLCKNQDCGFYRPGTVAYRKYTAQKSFP
jgi:hypothetical protein